MDRGGQARSRHHGKATSQREPQEPDNQVRSRGAHPYVKRNGHHQKNKKKEGKRAIRELGADGFLRFEWLPVTFVKLKQGFFIVDNNIYCFTRVLTGTDSRHDINKGDRVSGIAVTHESPRNPWQATRVSLEARAAVVPNVQKKVPPRPRRPTVLHGGVPKERLQLKLGKQHLRAQRAARARFDHPERPLAIPRVIEPPPRLFRLTWDVKSVPIHVEAEIAKQVVVNGEYGWLEGDGLRRVEGIVEGSGMNISQALSLRQALLKQKTCYDHQHLQYQADKIALRYKRGETVVDLARKFDFPPMNVFRAILQELKYSSTAIKACLRDPSRLKTRERKEMEAAEAADRISGADHTEEQQLAEEFEVHLEKYFTNKGIRVRRQQEIYDEQMHEYNHASSTPDILFLDHVEINGEPVAWIDAKNFYGCDVEFQRKKVDKQAKKYVDLWGSGALVFRHGFCDNLYCPGVSFLNAPDSVCSESEAAETSVQDRQDAVHTLAPRVLHLTAWDASEVAESPLYSTDLPWHSSVKFVELGYDEISTLPTVSYANQLLRSSQFSTCVMDDTFGSVLLETDHTGLKDFFDLGGTILVLPTEGLFAFPEDLSRTFGCNWKFAFYTSVHLVPREVAKAKFSEAAINQVIDYCKGKLLRVPENEAMWVEKIYEDDVYEDDEEEDEDDVSTFVRKTVNDGMVDTAAIAVHAGSNSGHLAYFGLPCDELNTQSAFLMYDFASRLAGVDGNTKKWMTE